MSCFICCGNSTNKVCFVCNCYAHPSCWHEYLDKSAKKCPICKTEKIYNKYITRNSPQKFLSEAKLLETKEIINEMFCRKQLISIISYKIRENEYEQNRGNISKQIKIVEDIFYLIYAGVLRGGEFDLLLVSPKFKETVKCKLNEFKIKWNDSENWQKLLFN
jgi:hypothetical protein